MSTQSRFQLTVSNQILFIGSYYSRKNLVFAKLCGLTGLKDYTIFPQKSVKGNIYINLIPSVELHSTQEVERYIEATLFSEFSKIKRIFFIVELRLDRYTNNLRIEGYQDITKYLQSNSYNQHVGFILTYQNCEKEYVSYQYADEKKVKFNQDLYPIVLVNTDQLDQVSQVNKIMNEIEQLLIESTEIKCKSPPDIGQTIQIEQADQINYILNSLDNQTLQNKSIQQLEQYIIFLKFRIFENLRIYDKLRLYELQQCCKVKFRQQIKSKILEITKLIEEKVQKNTLENIQQCKECKKLIDRDKQKQYCYQQRIFDHQEPQDFFILYSNNTIQSVCPQRSECKNYLKYDNIHKDEILVRKQNYLERITSYLDCFFDQNVHQDGNQLINEARPTPTPLLKAHYQVLLLGTNDSQTSLFSKLCNSQEYYTIFPRSSCKPFLYKNQLCNIYFQLSPNLVSFQEVDPQINLIDRVIYGSQQLDAILICINSAQQDTQDLKKLLDLGLYNKNIILIIQGYGDYQFQKIDLPCPTINWDQKTIDSQLFQEQLIDIMIQFPHPLTEYPLISEKEKEQVENMRPLIMTMDSYIKGYKFKNLSVQGIERLYYYICNDFLKEAFRILPVYSQHQYQFVMERFLYHQMVRQYYQPVITLNCQQLINRLEELFRLTNQANVKRCKYCQNLVYNSSNNKKLLCVKDRILTENRETKNFGFVLQQDSYQPAQINYVQLDQKLYDKNQMCTQEQYWDHFNPVDKDTLNQKISNFLSRIKTFQSILGQQVPQKQSSTLNSEHSKQEKVNQQINQDQEYQIILIGLSGVGKTSIFNKLCNIKQKIQYTLGSQTKKFPKGSIKGLTVFDTPSFDVRDEDGASNFQIIDQFGNFFLQIKQVNQIFILANYDRVAHIKKKIDECLNPLRKFKNMITFIITNMDDYLDQPEKRQELEKKIEQYYGKQIKLILTGDQVNSEILQRQIFQTLKDTKQQTLDLSETIFDVNSQSESGQKFVQGLNQMNYQLTQSYIQEQEDNIKQREKNKQENYSRIAELQKMINDYEKQIQLAKWEIDEKNKQNKKEDEAINNSNKSIKEYNKKLKNIVKDNPNLMGSQIYGIK